MTLIDEKKKIDRINNKNLACYIACCVWGKDPNEADGLDAPEGNLVAGRDFPIDASLLSGLL